MPTVWSSASKIKVVFRKNCFPTVHSFLEKIEDVLEKYIIKAISPMLFFTNSSLEMKTMLFPLKKNSNLGNES